VGGSPGINHTLMTWKRLFRIQFVTKGENDTPIVHSDPKYIEEFFAAQFEKLITEAEWRYSSNSRIKQVTNQLRDEWL
jgi:hypothetical protein